MAGQSFPSLRSREVDVLWHDYVSVNAEFVTMPHAFQGCLEDAAVFGGGEKGMAMVTAEGNEMALATMVKAC